MDKQFIVVCPECSSRCIGEDLRWEALAALADILHVDTEFLQPHLEARGVKIRRDGRRAKAVGGRCGVRPSARFAVFERDGFRCRYCNRHTDELDGSNALVVDHIHPVAQGGDSSQENLVTACRTCNAGKAAKMTARFAEA